ncbi:hypothetical protein [Nitratiruptor tergarcus]|uniref:Lipoprotein n=1 Tax=Nitratiruptor tergarcus DSM 16512 TaxID=1069081 RepID=A0A1W1WVE8_9BACT|nr:hypothetical protein [Nitratiruptor tergarcus]SMC10169.1 hypothetical protein SAMN05660197_2011 [Nitratiruptor tergarcus DSM 16512]
MIRIIFLTLLIFFSGCNLKSPAPYVTIKNVAVGKDINITKADRRLIRRFREYWQYRINGDYEHSYLYELPYQKYLIQLEKYKMEHGGKYKAKKIVLRNIRYDGGCAIIDRIVVIDDKNFTKKDKWCFIKDNWYHKFYQSIVPPKTIEEAQYQ